MTLGHNELTFCVFQQNLIHHTVTILWMRFLWKLPICSWLLSTLNWGPCTIEGHFPGMPLDKTVETKGSTDTVIELQEFTWKLINKTNCFWKIERLINKWSHVNDLMIYYHLHKSDIKNICSMRNFKLPCNLFSFSPNSQGWADLTVLLNVSYLRTSTANIFNIGKQTDDKPGFDISIDTHVALSLLSLDYYDNIMQECSV